MSPTPFVVGQWVRNERFYGRGDLITEILAGPRNSLWLLGTRRIGKTSLLKQLEHLAGTSQEHAFFPLFWDLQGSDRSEELHLGFEDALLDAEERLELYGLSYQKLQTGDLFSTLGRLRRALRSRRLRLLLLLDEVEELIKLHQKDPALLGKMRHALQASGGVRSILASTIRLWDLADQKQDTSPFLHGFTPPVYLGPLEDHEARSLVQQDQLAPDSRPSIPTDLAEAIARRCDNHPFLLQLVGKRFLETGDLELSCEQVAGDPMVSYFFGIDFEMLRPAERHLLRRMAQGLESEHLSARSNAHRASITTLEGLGYLRRRDPGGHELGNSFFRRWLLQLPDEEFGDSLEEPGGGDRTASSSTLAPGILEGRYELRRRVGDGATGVVFEAWDRVLRSKIAIKLLRAEYAGYGPVLERFRQEILLARDLGHPNILRVYHLGQVRERPFLTMQWVDGPTLAQVIAVHAPLAEARVLTLGAKLASALDFAHRRNVLHRDIKPDNIMLDREGEPLITDFGLARLAGVTGVTTGGIFLGTPAYVSPEQADMKPLDGRSDLYSLGVVLFEMATGRRPFAAEGLGEILELHRRAPPPDLRELRPNLSDGLCSIILRLMEKDPGRRFADAGELASALLAVEAAKPEEPGVKDVSATADEAAQAHPKTPEELLPLVYEQLRRLARGYLSRERPDHTLQPTALVHEAYLRLADQSRVDWQGRTHFLAVGARVMRRLLIDHARHRGRQKRGGQLLRVTFSEGLGPLGRGELGPDEVLALDQAIEELAAINERQAQVVELRFFSGMTVAEVAQHLGLSKRTVEADWAAARDWLEQRLDS